MKVELLLHTPVGVGLITHAMLCPSWVNISSQQHEFYVRDYVAKKYVFGNQWVIPRLQLTIAQEWILNPQRAVESMAFRMDHNLTFREGKNYNVKHLFTIWFHISASGHSDSDTMDLFSV